MVKLYQHNDKSYIRMGECNNCGACCLGGWINPCPNIINHDYSCIKCSIWNELGNDRNDINAYRTSGIQTVSCKDFPNGPSDLFDEEIRNKCGYFFKEVKKVLVTCPTHEVKEYCFQEWIDMAKNLTYPNYDILVVDNSPNEDYLNKWGSKVPMIHIDADQDPQKKGERICQSMSKAKEFFILGNYDWWMNIESDNIPPSNVIETLMEYGNGADWTSHCYPCDDNSDCLLQGIGCSLLSKRLMIDFDWSLANDSPDSELWNWVKPKNLEYKTVELWGIMTVKHLKNY